MKKRVLSLLLAVLMLMALLPATLLTANAAEAVTMTIQLQCSDLQASYPVNLPKTEMYFWEYEWSVFFTDGQSQYLVTTMNYKDSEEQKIKTLYEMESDLWVVSEETDTSITYSWLADCNLEIIGTSLFWTFTIPAEYNFDMSKFEILYSTVLVKGEYVEDGVPSLVADGFLDVPSNAFFKDAVAWAVENEITNGLDAMHFGPNNTCTRAQVVTFLWRAKGCPEPQSTVNPFTDVYPGDYFYKAVLWAKENNITTGTSDTTFSPNAGCTRAQVVTFLWRTEGMPEATSAANPFKDVTGGYYYDAVLWAVENGITAGTSTTTFSPDDTCTRGQIVTFLYRDLAK